MEDEPSLEIPLYSNEGNDSDLIEEDIPSSNISSFFSSKGTIHGYKDTLFLLLFALSVLVICAIALTYGTVSLANTGAEYWIVGADGNEIEDKSKEDIVSKIMLGITFVLSLSTVLSLAWVYLLSYVAIFMVNAIIISLVVISVLGAVVVLSLGYPSFGFLLLAVALATLLIALFFQSRIEFASVNLDVACKAVISMPSTIGYSLLMLLFQAAYVLIWCTAAIGFATNDYKISKFYHGQEYTLDQCSSYSYSSSFQVDGVMLECTTGKCSACLCEGVLVSNSPCFTPRFYWSSMFGLLLALIWTNSVMVNIVHCTVVAAVARWWTTGTCSVDALQYFFSTFTSTSLGSICFGSLLGAIVRTLRAVTGFVHARVRRSNDNSTLGKINRWAASFLDKLLMILDRIIVYFNKYAFSYVAIEEYDYIRASFAATTLLRARGFTALLNDDLLDFVVYISNIFIACVTMIASYIFAKVVRLPTVYLYLLVCFGFFCGYVMGAVVLSTISSAITAVYVCFARDPVAFQQTHPHLYAPLATAWNKIFPTAQSLASKATSSTGQQMLDGPHSDTNVNSKKVQFAVSSGAAIHGSYGNSGSGEKSGVTPNVDLTKREMGINTLGMGATALAPGSNSKQTGFWSSSLVQMVKQKITAPMSDGNNMNPQNTYARVSGHDEMDQVGQSDEYESPFASQQPPSAMEQPSTWDTASTMAANLITDLVAKNPFSSALSSASTGIVSSNNSRSSPWTPFPPSSSTGLHGGYGDYQLGYIEQTSVNNNVSNQNAVPEDAELQKYVGL